MENTRKIINLTYDEEYEIEELEARRLYINTEITPEIIDSIVFHIMRYNRLDVENNIAIENRTPIVIFLNSPGGDVVSGYALIDAILTSQTPVYTVNQGMCASMAFLIFLAGDKRFTMPHAEFLMHDGFAFSADSTAKAKDRMDFEMDQIEEMTKNYILSRTLISESLYKEKYRVEWYMLPEEAQTHKIATDIIGKDCMITDLFF